MEHHRAETDLDTAALQEDKSLRLSQSPKSTRSFGNSKYLFFVFAAFFLAAHLPTLSQPFVNLESWYGGAARLISEGKFADGLRYLDTAIANPVGSVLGIVPFYWLFGVSEFSARLSSLLAGVCLLGVLYYYCRSESNGTSLLAACVVGLNPLLWVYSGIAYSDVPFILLITATILTAAYASRTANMRLHLLGSALLGASALIKYNAVVAAPAIAAITLIEARYRNQEWGRVLWDWVRVMALYSAVCLLMLVPYLAAVHRILGYFMADRYVTSVGLSASSSLPSLTGLRMAALVTAVGIFCGPLALFPAAHMAVKFGRLRLLGTLLVASPIAVFVVQKYLETQNKLGSAFGEMQLGWTTHLLPKSLEIALGTLLLMAGSILVAAVVMWSLENFRTRGYIAIWLLLGIVLHSLARPTNRYVLFVLPPVALYIASTYFEPALPMSSQVKRVCLTASLFLLGCVGLFNSVYFATEGKAAAEVAWFINRNSLSGIEFQPQNSVQAHSGYLIRPELFIRQDSEPPRFTLVTLAAHESSPNIVYEVPVKILGLVVKRYAVLRNDGGRPA